MRPIAAVSVAPRQRRRTVAGADIAAAVLNATSCSVTRTGVGPRFVVPTADGADPTSGAAVYPGRTCDILRMPPDGWWLLSESQLRYGFTATAHELPLAFSGGRDGHLNEHLERSTVRHPKPHPNG
jgi:hypothetical protein